MTSSQPTPVHEPLAAVLDHALAQACTTMQHIEAILQHIGGPGEAQSNTPEVPGVMGKAFALRTQLQRINGKLESLASLL